MDAGWLELGVALFVIVGALRGFQRGLVREGMAFAGLAAGVTLASQWHSEVAAVLALFIGGGRLASALAYLLLVLAALGCATVLTVLILRLLRVLLVGWLDRVGGALFGAGQGAVLAALVLFLLVKYPFMGLDRAVRGSELATEFLSTMSTAVAYLPPEMAPMASFFDLPKLP